MDNLEPITRNEMFLNGDDLEPITREEMILAGADLEPLTRHEWFLKKYRGGGGEGGYDLVNIPNLPADIASFNDGTDLPMASLKVAVTPYQDLSHGDPSPENICPIIGWDKAVVTRCGANIGVIKNLYVGDTSELAVGSDGVLICFNAIAGQKYRLSGQNGNRKALYKFNGSIDEIVVGASMTSLVSGNVTMPYIFTADKTCVYCYYANSSWSETIANTLMVSVGESIIDYSPYNGATYTIDLDGTRYGGTLDATNGTMTVDKAYVDLGTLNWASPTTNIFNVAITDMNTEVKNKIMCSLYPLETTSFNWASVASYSDQSISTAGNNYIYVKDSRYSSAADFKTAMSGVQLVYELATPITVQLSPTAIKSLVGTNNIFANCGQITEVKYFKKA